MKHLLLTTIAAVVLVGCGETAKAPDISIHEAAGKGNVGKVNQHLAVGADVNAKNGNGDGTTPLDWAIKYNDTETADLLRKHGGKTSEELKAAGN